MIIANNYIKHKKEKQYTNEEFLVLQLWQLKHVFYNEISAIKNTKLEFIGFSNQYAIEFDHNDECLGKSLEKIDNVDIKLNENIACQESIIINTKSSDDSVFNHTLNNEYRTFLVRKRPLINPSTNEVVGLIIFAIKIHLGMQRKIILKNSQEKFKADTEITNKNFTEQQQQIITCLLLGFHQRKEIAAILSNITDKEYSETHIKNSLQALYNRFDCSSASALINLIAARDNMEFTLNGIKIPDSSQTFK